MGYRQEGSLAELYPEDFVVETGRKMTEAVGTRFRDRVAQKTPVARLPQAYNGNFGDWIEDRGGRTPRTLRDSWYAEPVQPTPAGHEVEVGTDDQIASFVEWDTRPHRITAGMRIDPRTGKLRQGALRIPLGPNFVFLKEVWHPGTQGVHMMRDTQAELETLWAEIGGRELDAAIAKLNVRR